MVAPGQLNFSEEPWLSRNVNCFEKLEQIGEGTYGQVFMARDKESQEIVALKKLRMDHRERGVEGFPLTAIREIKILQRLNPHPNIVTLKEIVTDCPQTFQDNNSDAWSVYMVFEYMDHDLAGLLDQHGSDFTAAQIKCYMQQLISGLDYCHSNHVLHRDIKRSNLLIDNNGVLKLGDFGLAGLFCSGKTLTNKVITMWYRPPELLLGATSYGVAVDMWSVGCVFAELLNNGKNILPGKDDADQVRMIFELCGSPCEFDWPEGRELPRYPNLKPRAPTRRRVREVFRHLDPHALDLVDKMLALDPSKRISAKEALDAEYFKTYPLPCEPRSLPKYEPSHAFQTKKKRHQQKLREVQYQYHG